MANKYTPAVQELPNDFGEHPQTIQEIRGPGGSPVRMPDGVDAPEIEALERAVTEQERAIDRKVVAPAGYLPPSRATSVEELRRDYNDLVTMLRSGRGMQRPSFRFDPEDVTLRSRWDLRNEEVIPPGGLADYDGTSGTVVEGDRTFAGVPTIKLISANGENSLAYRDIGPLDLSDAEFIELYMHFDEANPAALKASGSEVELRLYSGSSSNSFAVNTAVMFRADWIGGWQAVRVPVGDFDIVGSPDWSDIYRVRVRIRSPGSTGVAHLGPVRWGRSGRGVVQLHFDDAYRRVHELGLPILQKYGLRGTLPVIVGLTDASDGVTSNYMSWRQVRDCADAGWSVVSHWIDNSRLPDLTEAELIAGSVACRDALIAHGYHSGAECLVAPGGGLDEYSYNVIKAYTPVVRWGSYNLNREPRQGFPTAHPAADLYYSLSGAESPRPESAGGGDTPDIVKTWIDQAIASSSQTILVIHNMTDAAPTKAQYPAAWLDEICEYIRKKMDEGVLLNLTMTDVNHY